MNNDLYDNIMFSRLLVESKLIDDDSYLEISKKDAGCSVSSIINPYISDQLLVSPELTYDEASRFNLNGIRGDITNDIFHGGVHIVSEKSLDNDKLMLGKNIRSLGNTPCYHIPNIEEYNNVICQGYNSSILFFSVTPLRIIAGYCATKDSDELSILKSLYGTLQASLSFKDKNGYIVIKDQLRRSKKELFVLARKK